MLPRAWKIAYFHDFCQCIWSRKATFRQQMLPKITFYKNICFTLSNALPIISFRCFDRNQLHCKVKVKLYIFHFLQKMHFFCNFSWKIANISDFLQLKVFEWLFNEFENLSKIYDRMCVWKLRSPTFCWKNFRQHLGNICCLIVA